MKWRHRWEGSRLLGSVFAGWVALAGSNLWGEDWPQFRGPRHDGISLESDWRKNWDQAPPRVLWRSQVGIGFSALAVAKGRVVTLGHQDGEDVLSCLSEATGKLFWEYRYASPLGAMFYIGGPGSTPTIDPASERVWVLGKWGECFCFSLTDGELVWKRHLAKEEDLAVPDWGFNGSPLFSGDQILLNLGAAGMALEAATGKTIWRSEGTESGYSTPFPYVDAGQSLVVVSSGESYTAVKPASGESVWTIPWFTRYGVNAADPIVWNGKVFISSGYQKGSGLFALGTGELENQWKQRKFRAQQNAPVRIGKHVYGFDGDSSSRAMVKCLSLESGEILWEDETMKYGALSAADGHLILIAADGRLGVAQASPAGFKPILFETGLEADCWTVPVLANGRILCRNSKGSMVSLDVRKQ